MKITSVFSFIVGILIVYPQSAKANPISAVVERIMDGDTVVLNQGGTSKTIQLACIDAPDWPNGQEEPHAEASKNRLTQILPIGSSVQYYDLGALSGGRILAVIFNNDRNINLQMVAEGQARLHPNYRQTCTNSADTLADAESNSRSQGLGIWNP